MRSLAALLLVATMGAFAQSWPTKPIRIIVPFAPGGNVDITARLVAPGLQELLGQPVVIENKPGAGGTIGADFVAKSAPDGYTLLMGSNSTFSVAPSLYPKNPYHPIRDFSPVIAIAATPFILVVNPGTSPANITVRYLRGTPLGSLRAEANIERIEGVKTFAVGRISDASGVATVQAEGVFIHPRSRGL